MIVGKVQYYVYITCANRTVVNVTQAVEDLGWEENEKELSARVSFTLYNVKCGNQYLSQMVKMLQPVVIKASMGGSAQPVMTGVIREMERDSSKSEEAFKITAYDFLFSMQKSQDSFYFSSGKSTRTALMEIFSRWYVPVAVYHGPDVRHGKLVYKGKSLADIVLDILDDARKKGGPRCIIRAAETGGKISVLKEGENAEIYRFDRTNAVEVKYKASVTNIVTRVRIMSTEKNDEKQKVEALVDGDTAKYGIIQKIENMSGSESLADAKKEAQEVLNENGSPKYEFLVVGPDVPVIRKGDRVQVYAGELFGSYVVKSIQHNADKGTLTMKVKAFT